MSSSLGSYKRDLTAVEKLIKEGAQVQFEYGESPFYQAAEYDHRACIVALLRTGVDFNRENAPAAQEGNQNGLCLLHRDCSTHHFKCKSCTNSPINKRISRTKHIYQSSSLTLNLPTFMHGYSQA